MFYSIDTPLAFVWFDQTRFLDSPRHLRSHCCRRSGQTWWQLVKNGERGDFTSRCLKPSSGSQVLQEEIAAVLPGLFNCEKQLGQHETNTPTWKWPLATMSAHDQAMNDCQCLLLQRGAVCMLKPLARYETVHNIPHILLEALTGSKRWSIRPPPIRHASGNRKIWINGSVYDKVSPVFAVATGLQRHFTSYDMENRSRGQRVDATVTGTEKNEKIELWSSDAFKPMQTASLYDPLARKVLLYEIRSDLSLQTILQSLQSIRHADSWRDKIWHDRRPHGQLGNPSDFHAVRVAGEDGECDQSSIENHTSCKKCPVEILILRWPKTEPGTP